MARFLHAALLWAQLLALGLFLYGFFPVKKVAVGGGGDRQDCPVRNGWVSE